MYYPLSDTLTLTASPQHLTLKQRTQDMSMSAMMFHSSSSSSTTIPATFLGLLAAACVSIPMVAAKNNITTDYLYSAFLQIHDGNPDQLVRVGHKDPQTLHLLAVLVTSTYAQIRFEHS